MDEHEYALMRRVEDSHWWYAALRGSVAGEVKALLSGRTGGRILDAGCGTGGMMEALRRENPAWKLCGLDSSPVAIGHTRERGFQDLALGSVDALPYAAASFDVVLSLDILYFEGVDEARAMGEFQRVLKPGGVLVLNLPAFDFLRGRHDVAVKGVRRYTPARVRELIARSGLEAPRVHCWNLWLFLPILCWRLLSRVPVAGGTAAPRSDLSMPHAFPNSVLAAIARLDMALCRAISSPLGTSVQAVARKPMA